MANKKIKVEELGAAIAEILNEYAGDITQNIPEITEKVGKTGVQALKNSTRAKVNGKKYWKGWKDSFERNRFGATVTLYNAKLPGLAHLLEHGHAKRNGGRTAAKIHISPVEEKLIDEFERKIENDINRNR